jgi:hypothetical protein
MASSRILTNNPNLALRVIAVLVVLFFYDVLWDLCLSVLHSLAMLLHFLFEFCEHALDVFIEHVFHTDPRTTEIIVFYIMAGVIAAISLRLVLAIPYWYCQICESIKAYWFKKKLELVTLWQVQPITQKVKWGSVFFTSSVLMLALAFS